MLFCMPVFAQGVKLPSVTNSIGMELIEIPAGKFTMGSPEDEKKRFVGTSMPYEEQVAVTLTKPFLLGKYEVTQGQWKEVMGTELWTVPNTSRAKAGAKADKDCPAAFVSWDDATEFCKKLTQGEMTVKAYRLPTEAEWEYACRAGTTTAFSFGDDISKLGEYAWFDGNAKNIGEEYAHKVGLKKPNPWGLYDMHGNVLEWCSDRYHDHDNSIYKKLLGGTDPVGPGWGSHRVYRGGCCMNFGGCRSAARAGSGTSGREFNLGFRVARSQSAP